MRVDHALDGSSELPGTGRVGGEGARERSYEVVVVGAGMGGLTAGALLAHAGKKVLVVEAETQAGGYARALRRGAYTFDRADHLIMGCASESPFGPGLIDTVLRHLGVRDRCQFIRLDDPMYAARFPDFTLSVPHGRQAYLEAHLSHFPSEARGLRRLVDLSAEIFRGFSAFPMQPGLSDLLLSPWRFPAMFRYRNATMSDVIDRELHDHRLKAVYATLWPWIGPPPARASFLAWAAMMASYVEDGAYYAKGSFQTLADALSAALVEAGGEVLLGTRVTRILAEGRRVQGVVLDTGQQIRVPVVISNIDARETFENLVGPNRVPARFMRRLRRMQVSDWILAFYAATDLDLAAMGAQHDTTLYTEWDHDVAYARARAGGVPWLSILIPTLKDPSLAPPGEHLVILKAVAPAEAGQAPRDDGRLADRMLDLAESALPGLRQHLTFVDQTPAGSGPHSPLHLLGPYSGWAASPQQSGIRRLPQQTPLAGLVLAGQWTQPGHGIWTVMRSGVAAAQYVLGAPTFKPALPLSV